MLYAALLSAAANADMADHAMYNRQMRYDYSIRAQKYKQYQSDKDKEHDGSRSIKLTDRKSTLFLSLSKSNKKIITKHDNLRNTNTVQLSYTIVMIFWITL